ncbi:MAG: FAD-dependent oxidoreductase [Oscillospiraceae bacterium]|nr:FAD-dependent oxidoreductase [Oscillospiraceae bacterium]
MNHKFLEPIKVGNVELKNRIFYLGMAKFFSTMDGQVTDREVAYVDSIAAGGVAMHIVGGMVIDPTWPSTLPMQTGLYDDSLIPGLTRLTEAAHKHGAKILFQPWHPGQLDYSGGNPPTINELTVEQLKAIQDQFVGAAERAMKAGADGVEIQCCHNYFIHQTMSPSWNHRTDAYGGSLENRMRFAVETISRVREVIGPDKILSVKLQGTDCEGGYASPATAAEEAPFIEKAGADMITLSGGGGLSDNEHMAGFGDKPEGWKVPAAEAVKKVVSIPVAASGSIRHVDYIDQIMAEGKCDMVGMARGLYAEREFVNKCMAGKENTLRHCISCGHCSNMEAQFLNDMSGCSVNPHAARELYKKPLVKNGDGRVVVIVGAGPAGMEAAVTLAQRGFKPIVLDKNNRIGGNVNLAMLPPDKYKFEWMIEYYENMAKELNIDVRLNTEATAEMIVSLNPYSVLIAAGSNVTVPPIAGLTAENSIQSRTILEEGLEYSGKNLVVVGGGTTGIEVALLLRKQGNEVCVVDFAAAPPADQETARDIGHCAKNGIALYYSNKVNGVADGVVTIENVETGEVQELKADLVVLSTGVIPNNELFMQLKAMEVPQVYAAGDANMIGKIYKAVMLGSKYGYALK